MKIRRKMRQKRSHGVLWGVTIAVLATAFIAYGAVQGVLGVIDEWLTDLPSVENSDKFNYTRKTKVYAADSTTLLAELYLEDREPVATEQISPYVLEGTVATEDERFYEHNGVDPQGIARALFVNLKGGELEGASTITMQFIRNTILEDEATEISLERKVKEAQLAINLEKVYTKEQILTMYLNTINYGDGAYGIEAASKNYFSKSALDLTIAEAATLIGIPQSPTYLNPKTNPESCLERRNLVLSRMLGYGTISEEEYNAAKEEPLTLNPKPADAVDGIYAYPYYTSYIQELLFSEEAAEKFSLTKEQILTGGLTIITSLDVGLQQKAEMAAQQQYDSMDSDIALALTCVDPQTGYIKAMIGGKDFYSSHWNLATQAKRQPGSSFKAFTLVTAIEQGINPNTMIDCSSPVVVPGYESHPFSNYGGAQQGVRSIQSATAASSNTGFIRLSQKTGVSEVIKTAHRMGITSEIEDVPASVLGSAGISNLEMANAYAVLAAEGTRHEPVAISSITSWTGEILYQHADVSAKVLTPEVAYATTKVLKTVISGGTGTSAALPSGQPAAGKTGTSEHDRDKWFVGYTPQLCTAVWIGYPEEERSVGSSLLATHCWRNFMSMALEGYQYQDFTQQKDPPYENVFNKEQESAYPPDPAEAPDVVGKSLTEATNLLRGYTIKHYEEYSDTVAAGIVISQTVSEKTIILVVSLGPDPTPPEPEPIPTPEPTDPGPDPAPPPEPEPTPKPPDPEP